MFGMSILHGYALPALYQTRRKRHAPPRGREASSCLFCDARAAL